MKKIIAKFSWVQLLLGLILVGLGVLTIVFAANGGDDFDKNVFISWAAVLFTIALTIIVVDILTFSTEAEFTGLITAGVCIGVGIFVLANRDFIHNVITSLLPYVLISIGGVLLLKTIILAAKRVNFKDWLSIFIVSVVFLTTGIVFLCVSGLDRVIYIVIGILLIVLGAIEVIGYVTVLSQKHANKKEQQLMVKANNKKKNKKEKQDGHPEENKEVVEAKPKEISKEDDIKLIE